MAAAQGTLTPQEQLEQAQEQLKKAQQALEEAQKKAQQATQQQAEAAKTSTWVVPQQATAKKSEQKAEKKTTASGATLKCDPKYLDGAVTLNTEGKIVFAQDIQAPGKSAQQIYDLVYPYMQELTQGGDQVASRVALVNPTEHVIANAMDEWIVFNSSFISLDRSRLKYNLIATISDGLLHIEMGRMSYAYETDRPTGFRAPAEEVISDKVALTKKKNNLAKVYGKFRRMTIDRKDQIFSELETILKK